MELSPELRDHLDGTGGLRTHVTDDDITREQDLDDAAALLAVSRGVDVLRTNLKQQGVSVRNLKVVEDRIVNRSGREVIERIWENSRRRTAGRPVLSNKFAHGGLWSPAAAAFVLESRDYKNQLVLEYVVPAKAIVTILSAYAAADGDAEGAVQILAELFAHVVLTREDDRALSREMTAENTKKLADHYADHYAGRNTLAGDELFEVRWSRYLATADAGTPSRSSSQSSAPSSSTRPSSSRSRHRAVTARRELAPHGSVLSTSRNRTVASQQENPR